MTVTKNVGGHDSRSVAVDVKTLADRARSPPRAGSAPVTDIRSNQEVILLPHNPVVTLVDGSGNAIGSAASPLQTSDEGTATATVPAGPGNTVVKGGPGHLNRIVVTGASPTGVLTFYDNASSPTGTVLAIVPSGVAQGTAYNIRMPAVNGIVAAGATGSAAVTVSYS